MVFHAKLDRFVAAEFHDLLEVSPLVIYDVGAALQIFDLCGYDDALRTRIVGFEPVSASCLDVQKMYKAFPNIEIVNAALADVTGKTTFNLYPSVPTKSGLKLRDVGLAAGELEGRNQEEVSCYRLDDVAKELPFPNPDFLKLDVEGGELDVLNGGPEKLDQEILGIFTEICWAHSLVQSYDGPTFADIEIFLRDRGFVLFDFSVGRGFAGGAEGVGGKKGRPLAGDALYLRDFSQYYNSTLQNRPLIDQKIKLIKMLMICYSYRFLDYACDLVCFGKDVGILTDEEYRTILDGVRDVHDAGEYLAWLPWRDKIARMFQYASYILSGDMNKGVPSGFNTFGNPRKSLLRGKKRQKILIKNSITRGGADFEITL